MSLTSTGCELGVGTVARVCGLGWDFSQHGDDLEILVDNEYVIAGRMCGDELHLDGGFWFTVQGEVDCDCEDGVEVGIEAGGATLNVTAGQLAGTLALRERCTADYAVVFHP